MRVLMTTDGVGGVWNYSIRLAEALRERDVQVALATMGPALTESQHWEARRLPDVQLHESTFKLEWMRDPWGDVSRAGKWLLRLEKRLKPDIVHLNNYVHGSLAWSSPVLVVGHSCVYSWFEAVHRSEPTADWTQYKRRVRQGLLHANLVTAPTAAALDALRRHYGPFRSIGPIYNGWDAPDDVMSRSDDVVFCAGRLWDPAKNIATLHRAAKEIYGPVFAAGSIGGPDGQRIELACIRHLGHLDQGALQEWYHRTAVFVLPSVYEPFGLAALEAALAGCALVLGDIPSLREVWADAAIFVPPQDHRALARQVNRLLEDTRLRRYYARRARQTARTYTLRRMAGQYHRSYCHLIQKQATTSAGTLAANPL